MNFVRAAWSNSITPADAYYLTIIALIRITPRAQQALLISCMANAAYWVSRKKRAAIERNLDVAFGSELSSSKKERIVRGTFCSFWRELFDWSLPPLVHLPVEWHGIEHLQAARRNGRGIILWESNGFGKRLLPKRILHANGCVLTQVHGANNLGGFLTDKHTSSVARRVKSFFDARERRFTSEIIYLPANDSFAFTRTLLARLRANAILCVTGDGRTGQKFLSVPFLGQRVPLASGMVNLARLARSPILPLFCHSERNGKVCITVEPPLALDRGTDRATATRLALKQYACLLEQRIRAYPEQYRNWHLV